VVDVVNTGFETDRAVEVQANADLPGIRAEPEGGRVPLTY
jgi:hypothetical protein